MEDVYKKLNSCLNDWFVKNEKSEKLLIENLENIFYITHKMALKNMFHNINNIDVDNNKMDSMTSIFYAREIIKSIDKKMLDKFDECISNGILNVNENEVIEDKENKYKRENFYKCEFNNGEFVKQQIEFNLSYTTDDIALIVHEFIHYYLSNIKRSDTYIFLSEFFSIYFEVYCIKYMEQYDDIKLKIDKNKRIKQVLECGYMLRNFIPIFITYQFLGNINEKSKMDLKQYMGIYYEKFDENCVGLLKIFVNNYKNIEEAYKYVVGTILTYYCIDNIDPKTVLDFGIKINTEEYFDLSLTDVLRKIYIILDFNMIDKSLDKINNIVKNAEKQKTI